MSDKKSFAVIGGDMRQIRLANALLADGYPVKVFGFDGDVEYLHIPVSESLSEALAGARIIILPLPITSANGFVNTPLCKDEIELNTLLENLNKNQILMAGKIDEAAKTLIDIHGIYAVDYFMREELSVLNAELTAEGGIQIALNELPIALCGSSCLVIGFGRIGKLLCKMLSGMGANVCAAARKPEAFAWIDSFGYQRCHTDSLKDEIGRFDVVFNTVPYPLLDMDVLSSTNQDVLIIDLASKPGGVCLEAAKQLGRKTIWALSLPGRIAPVSAGDIIKHTVLNICKELGV